MRTGKPAVDDRESGRSTPLGAGREGYRDRATGARPQSRRTHRTVVGLAIVRQVRAGAANADRRTLAVFQRHLMDGTGSALSLIAEGDAGGTNRHRLRECRQKSQRSKARKKRRTTYCRSDHQIAGLIIKVRYLFNKLLEKTWPGVKASGGTFDGKLSSTRDRGSLKPRHASQSCLKSCGIVNENGSLSNKKNTNIAEVLFVSDCTVGMQLLCKPFPKSNRAPGGNLVAANR